MRTDVTKSKLDPRKLLIFSAASIVLLLVNLLGGSPAVYGAMDTVVGPFLIASHNFAFDTNLLFREMANKSAVLKENVELKRKVAELEEAQVKQKNYEDELKRLESQIGITYDTSRKLKLVKISGIQNLFTSDPEIIAYIGSDSDVKKGDIVYYHTNTLLGFVHEVNGRTAKIIPYYSPKLNFTIPVQSIDDPMKNGFIQKIENGTIKIKNVPKTVTVSTDEIWITTNDIANVPPNLIIGKIKSVRNEPQEAFQELEVSVMFDLSETSYIFMEQ